MEYLALILFGLIESVSIYVLWICLKTGKAPMGPSGQMRADKKFQPFTYWLWVAVSTIMAVFVVPYMAYVAVAGLSV